MNCAAVASAYTKPEQAPDRSKPHAFFAPILVWTRQALEKHIGRDGRNYDQIQLGWIQPAFFAQSFGGGSADVAGRLAFLNDTALADTRPCDDPFIRGIDDFF